MKLAKYCVFLVLLISCVAQRGEEKLNQSENSIRENPRIPLDQLWKIAGARAVFWPDTSPTHTYSGRTLIWKSGSDRGEYIYQTGQGIQVMFYRETFPGIVFLQNYDGQIVEVEFYKLGILENKIDLIELNPYKVNEFKNLTYGVVNFENLAESSESADKLDREPTEYLTYFFGLPTTIRGFTLVSYQLVSLSNKSIVNWQSTIMAINSNGALIGKIVENNYTYPIESSSVNNLIAYQYGNYPDNPIDSSPKGEIRIRDLIQGQEVLRILPKGDQVIGVPIQANILAGMVRVTYPHQMSKGHTIIDLIDLDHRVRYYHDFLNEEFNTAWNAYKGFLPLLDFFPFTKTTF